MSFAPKETTISLRRRGYAAAAAQFAEELAAAFGYPIGAFALFGLWRLRLVLGRPVDRFTRVYFAVFSLLVIHFAAKEGYLGARHLMTLVVLGIGCAGYGLLEVGRWLARDHLRISQGDRSVVSARGSGPCPSRFLGAPGAAWAVVSVAVLVCFLVATRPLHSSRLGHRRAAEWLAEEGDVPNLVLDTRGWTGLYSGRPTVRYEEAQIALADPQLAYVVLERRELEYGSRRSRTLRHLLDVAAEAAAEFPRAETGRREPQKVLVYRWNPDRFSRWLSRRTEGLKERPKNTSGTVPIFAREKMGLSPSETGKLLIGRP